MTSYVSPMRLVCRKKFKGMVAIGRQIFPTYELISEIDMDFFLISPEIRSKRVRKRRINLIFLLTSLFINSRFQSVATEHRCYP
jgi:hypothetical protein